MSHRRANHDDLVAPDPVVSVIVVTWNCEGHLSECLDALAVEAHNVPIEVICVDNASDDASAEVAQTRGARVLRLPVNAGFPTAVNMALQLCRAPLVLLLNPDVRIEPHAIERCVDVIEGDPTIGVLGCNVRRPDGRPDPAAARRFRSLSNLALESLGLTRVWPRLDFQYFPTWPRTTSRDVPCINGAFALTRSGHLRDLGGLDTSVFLYLEDQELCRQTWARGLRVHFFADARAVHAGSGPTLLASAERQTAAYLHRLDATIEIIARRQGGVARLAAILLLLTRTSLGLLVTAVRRDAGRMQRYACSIHWLLAQIRHRQPPPAVP